MLRKGKRVSLSEKAFEMLCVLVRQSGHLVSKDELLAEVWTDTIVEENNLDKNVSLLRQVLGERKGKEKFIETVRGRGYRFVVEVRQIEVESRESRVESQSESQISNFRFQNGNVNGDEPPTINERQIIENQQPIIKDHRQNPQSAIRNPKSNKVIALADWRHEPEENEKSLEAILTPAQITEFPIAKRKKFPLFGAIVFGLLILALGYFAFTRFRSETPTTDAPIKTLAILPFENGSNDANLDYLSDGLSESLIDRLSQLPQLKVIARSSSFKYRGANIDLQDVANKLGVEAIITGRVMQRGDNLSIRVEMVDARDNKQLWGEQFNRKVTDALVIQKEIAQTVSEKLRLKLSGAQERQIARQDTVNPQAYELLLRGRFTARKGGTENQKKAIEYYRQAIAVDPDYAPAHAKLSIAYAALAANSVGDPKEFIPKAQAAARKALELDENLAESHLALANLYRTDWDWSAAEAEYKRAIELNPNLSDAHLRYSDYLSNTGRHEQAIEEAKRGKELDPLSLSANLRIGWALFIARRYDEAIAETTKAFELNQKPVPATEFGYVYAAKGMHREAVAAYRESIRLGDTSPSMQIYLGAAYANAGERENAQAILKQLEAGKEYVSPGELAILYGALGEREKAFASLEKAYAAHDLQLQFLKVDPAFDTLRDDPRFQDLMRRVGLPQ
ncbi:MAG: winged helix-turn-helix domain-containing protein [Acidobacteria bacterium]|nr:winged helix-turn-helix domain-containing protein [Acidobacteriota bacterium]